MKTLAEIELKADIDTLVHSIKLHNKKIKELEKKLRIAKECLKELADFQVFCEESEDWIDSKEARIAKEALEKLK